MSFEHIIVGLGPRHLDAIDAPPAGPEPEGEGPPDRVERFAAMLAEGLGARLVRVHAGPVDPAVASRPGVQSRPGPAAAALQNEAERLDADLIVIGSGAHSAAPELGATTTTLLRNLTLPLLIVPTHGAEPAPPSFRRLVVPIDFTAEGDLALVFVKRLSDRLGAELTLTHVLPPPLKVSELAGQAGLGESAGELLDAVAAAREELAAAARRNKLGAVRTEVVEANHPWEGVAESARRVHAGFIALPAHGRGRVLRFLVGSTTERLLKAADVPVLVFPPSWIAARIAETKKTVGDRSWLDE